jgi:periplasmic divalent cation tolerance protein
VAAKIGVRAARGAANRGEPMIHEYVIVLTTLPPDADAAAFGRSVVEERLAACVNVMPLMESIYRWEGTIEQETERQVVMKTSREQVVALWERVREMHPYDVPEFLVLPIVDGNNAYLRWIAEATSADVENDEADDA